MLRVIVAAVGGFIFGAGATAGLLFTLGNPRQIDSDTCIIVVVIGGGVLSSPSAVIAVTDIHPKLYRPVMNTSRQSRTTSTAWRQPSRREPGPTVALPGRIEKRRSCSPSKPGPAPTVGREIGSDARPGLTKTGKLGQDPVTEQRHRRPSTRPSETPAADFDSICTSSEPLASVECTYAVLLIGPQVRLLDPFVSRVRQRSAILVCPTEATYFRIASTFCLALSLNSSAFRLTASSSALIFCLSTLISTLLVCPD